MNKYKPHVFVIPEDDKNRQLANGFVEHPHVKNRSVQVAPVAKGWSGVLQTFKDEYVRLLNNNQNTHVVMLIDFDEQFHQRWQEFQDAIPEDLKPRVFVIGSRDEPETLVKELKMKPEKIGEALADDCDNERIGDWGHEQLVHNDPERKRLELTVRVFLLEPKRLKNPSETD